MALLQYLCNANETEPPMTVTSLKAKNVGYTDNMTVHIIDYPGHPSPQLASLLLPAATTRLVSIINATQPRYCINLF